MEKEFKGKKIKFVSVSIDKNRQAWKTWVKENALKGMQLHLGENQDFMQRFNMRGIPRFIIIGKNGEVILSEAYRPTEGQKTSDFLKNLKGI